MNDRDLDRHITGNWGEDSVGEDSYIDWNEWEPVIFVDGNDTSIEELFEMYMQSQHAIKRLNQQVHNLKIQNKRMKNYIESSQKPKIVL